MAKPDTIFLKFRILNTLRLEIREGDIIDNGHIFNLVYRNLQISSSLTILIYQRKRARLAYERLNKRAKCHGFFL
jgi:hypothetical protein